jgi:hypothetical protein
VSQEGISLFLRFNALGPVAQIPFRSLRRIFDNSKVRFNANPKLALGAQTLSLQPFRFTKNGYQNSLMLDPGMRAILVLLFVLLLVAVLVSVLKGNQFR